MATAKANKPAADPAKKETFFPGVRKPVTIDDVRPLAAKSNEKRIKIDMVIDLSDNQVTGIPEWLADGIILVRKGEAGWGMNKNNAELDGVVLRFYSAFGDDTPALELSGVLLKGFQIRKRGKDAPAGELADSELAFTAYTWWDRKTWKWGFDAFNHTVWTLFGTLQAKLSFGDPPKKDGKPDATAEEEKPPLLAVIDANVATQPGETDDDARRRATSAEFDKLFDPSAQAEAAGAGITDDIIAEELIVDTPNGKDTRPAGPRLVGARKAAAKKSARGGTRHVN